MIYDEPSSPICQLHRPAERYSSCCLVLDKHWGFGKCSVPPKKLQNSILRSGGGGNWEYFWPGWWHTLAVAVLGRLMQEGPEFKATLDYLVRPCFKNRNNKNKPVSNRRVFLGLRWGGYRKDPVAWSLAFTKEELSLRSTGTVSQSANSCRAKTQRE